jgi:hypothetical protein
MLVTISSGAPRWTSATFIYNDPKSTPRIALAETNDGDVVVDNKKSPVQATHKRAFANGTESFILKFLTMQHFLVGLFTNYGRRFSRRRPGSKPTMTARLLRENGRWMDERGRSNDDRKETRRKKRAEENFNQLKFHVACDYVKSFCGRGV